MSAGWASESCVDHLVSHGPDGCKISPAFQVRHRRDGRIQKFSREQNDWIDPYIAGPRCTETLDFSISFVPEIADEKGSGIHSRQY